MKKLIISGISLAIVAVLIIGSVIISNNEPKLTEKTIYIEVSVEENTQEYMIKTDEIYLLGALENSGFLKGEMGEVGFVIDEIGGVKKTDNEHFELFINKQRRAESVDKIKIENKATYKFELTK